jgi:hypothetical protein
LIGGFFDRPDENSTDYSRDEGTLMSWSEEPACLVDLLEKSGSVIINADEN